MSRLRHLAARVRAVKERREADARAARPSPHTLTTEQKRQRMRQIAREAQARVAAAADGRPVEQLPPITPRRKRLLARLRDLVERQRKAVSDEAS